MEDYEEESKHDYQELTAESLNRYRSSDSPRARSMSAGSNKRDKSRERGEGAEMRMKKSGSSPARSEKSYKSGESMTSVMLDTKNNRKRAEADLQLLANRIALLRAEEAKAMAKISETKTRAKEIITFKKRNEDAIQQRVYQNMEKEMQIKAVRDKVTEEKEARKKSLAQSRKIAEDSRRLAAMEVKRESKQLQSVLMKHKEAGYKEKQFKATEEKQRQEIRRRQQELERAEKERMIHREYARKVADEARRQSEAENLISMLEKEELELIERLKSAQSLQQKAYSALQTSLDL